MSEEKAAVVIQPGTRQDHIFHEYQQMAAGYDKGSAECGWAAPQVVVDALEHMGLLKPDMDIIDFAVGTGALSCAFRRSTVGDSLYITGTDLSPAMLDRCRAKAVVDELYPQDVTKPWQTMPGSKDLVAATGVGEYLTPAELVRVVREASKALRPGGIFAFTFLPAAAGVPASTQQEHGLEEFESYCRQSGVALEAVHSFDAYRGDDGNTVKHVLAIGRKAG